MTSELERLRFQTIEKECLNKVFGRIKVIEILNVDKYGHRRCKGLCTCGNIKELSLSNLKSGKLQSCGCLHREVIKNNRNNNTYVYNETLFKTITEESAYIIGLLSSDGSITNNSVTISLQESDKNILYKIRDIICPDKPIYIKDYTKYKHGKNSYKKQFTLQFGNAVIREQLKLFNIIPNKSLTYTVPDVLKDSRDFWRGVLDGDGYITIHKKGYFVLSLCGTESICNSFKLYCQSITNHNCNVCIDKRHINHAQISFSSTKAELIYKHIYEDSNLYIDRKKAYLTSSTLVVKNNEFDKIKELL